MGIYDVLTEAEQSLQNGHYRESLDVLKQVWITIVVIATVGVLITAAITGLGAWLILGVRLFDMVPVARHLLLVVEGGGDLFGDGPGLVEGHGALGGFAFDELHDEGAVFDAVDGGDVGVVERGQDFGFALEAGHALGVVAEGGRQDLDGDVALEFGVAAAVDLTHASFTQQG